MSRVLLVSSEAVRPRMGGIGIRYLEMARHLLAAGFEVRLVSPAGVGEMVAAGLPESAVTTFRSVDLPGLLAEASVVVAQGQLANDVVQADPSAAVVIDLYDPWLVENLHYAASLGYGPYRNDHASWVVQMSRGDVFLCASREQRLFYLGFLAALGRVNPHLLEEDPGVEKLILEVPFGCPAPCEPDGGLLPPRSPGESRILFGGIYDWYDVETFVEALAGLEVPIWSAWLVRNPNPDSTPQEKFAQLERAARKRGWWGERVRTIDWVPADKRLQLLADVDVLVGPHLPGLESELALRTRFLDALAAGCPVISTAGGTVSRWLLERNAGWVVPPRDHQALARAMNQVLAGGGEVEARVERGRELAMRGSWESALAPLIAFLRSPWRDPSRVEFSRPVATRVGAEPWMTGVRRRLRRLGRGRSR